MRSLTLQTKNVLKEIEEIKTRLISIEMIFIETEQATKEDKKAVKEALEEYKRGRTTPFSS